MSAIIDKIEIACTPEQVFDTLVFFFRDTENYQLWHADHISCSWKKGGDFSPGSVLMAEEYIHGKWHKLGFKITTFKKGDILEYKMLFPFSIICSGGNFKSALKHDKTEFIAQLNFRLGWFIKALFKKEMEALRNHMREEGENIKEFIEKKHPKGINS